MRLISKQYRKKEYILDLLTIYRTYLKLKDVKNLQIITRLSTKIGNDKEKEKFCNIIEKNDHRNV